MISLLASKSCEKRSKGIEQTWCRVSKSARGDGKFAANAATPLQHASAGDSPPTTLLCFSQLASHIDIGLTIDRNLVGVYVCVSRGRYLLDIRIGLQAIAIMDIWYDTTMGMRGTSYSIWKTFLHALFLSFFRQNCVAKS